MEELIRRIEQLEKLLAARPKPRPRKVPDVLTEQEEKELQELEAKLDELIKNPMNGVNEKNKRYVRPIRKLIAASQLPFDNVLRDLPKIGEGAQSDLESLAFELPDEDAIGWPAERKQ